MIHRHTQPEMSLAHEFFFVEEGIPWVRCVKCKTAAKFKQFNNDFLPPLGWDTLPWNKLNYPLCGECNSGLLKLWEMTVKRWVEFPLPEADA